MPQTGFNGGAIAINTASLASSFSVHATVLSNDRIVIRVNPEVR